MPRQRRLRNQFRPRTDRQQIELACRILENGFFNDLLERAEKEMGDRAYNLGPLSMERNLARVYVGRLNKVRVRPPYVSGMGGEVALAFGDVSAGTLIERYRDAGGAPLPTPLVREHTRAQGYQIFVGYVGVALRYAGRADKLYVETIRPSDLDLFYGDDDPTEPTIVDHHRERMVNGEYTRVVDRYDLTDLDAPRFRVLRAGDDTKPTDDDDVTAQAMPDGWTNEEFWSYYRDAEGKPFHPIVISGHPSRVWENNQLVEGTLSLGVMYTHHNAGIRDSCHAAENVMDLELYGMDSDEETRAAGMPTGPEIMRRWKSIDPERPGQHWQSSPPYDPDVVGRAIRERELMLLSSLGLPVAYERTGGDPTEQERRALEEAIQGHYAECRMLDGRIIQRGCMLLNRIAEIDGAEAGREPLSELPYGVLYREEIDEALETAAIAGGEKPADTALNGAQVQAATEIVQRVAQKQLPRATGVYMLRQFFNIGEAEAETLMGDAGQSFRLPPEAAP